MKDGGEGIYSVRGEEEPSYTEKRKEQQILEKKNILLGLLFRKVKTKFACIVRNKKRLSGLACLGYGFDNQIQPSHHETEI